MSFLSPSQNNLLHKIHRWGGLILAFFILFYSITGIMLNHRKLFNYFIDKDSTEQQVSKFDLTEVNNFIEHYKKEINRSDTPKLIRIRDDGTIEFLYGSHGKTTYIIDSSAGLMKIVTKNNIQPLFLLNRLHKASMTEPIWIFLADTLSLFLILITISSLLIMRYRALDFLLIFSGIILIILGGFFA